VRTSTGRALGILATVFALPVLGCGTVVYHHTVEVLVSLMVPPGS
jgi:hypothetical protein